MNKSFYEQRLRLQDALLLCRSEFMACASQECPDRDTALLLAAQLVEIEAELGRMRQDPAACSSGALLSSQPVVVACCG